ncbi:hypothetical protein TNCV_4687401 [Trichonephila clavipes]|nr:hypothetical protein TNCV_4687401 [Trichonephila clavipes]
MSTEAMMISALRFYTTATSVLYKSDFRWSQKKKIKRIKVQGAWSPSNKSTESNLSPAIYVTWSWLRTAIEKGVGTPPYMNQTFGCTVACTSCSNSGRNEKFAYVLVS